jgi:hypothetical protein
MKNTTAAAMKKKKRTRDAALFYERFVCVSAGHDWNIIADRTLIIHLQLGLASGIIFIFAHVFCMCSISPRPLK